MESNNNVSKLRRMFEGSLNSSSNSRGETLQNKEYKSGSPKSSGNSTGIVNKGQIYAPNMTNTVVSGDNNVTTVTVNTTATPILRPERVEFNIQECVPKFVGREDFIKDIHKEIFLNQKTTPPSVRSRLLVICGMAGVGKTQTVRKYIDLHKQLYGHVLWINSENYNEATSCFLRLARELSIDPNFNGSPKPDEDILAEIYDYIFQKFSLIVYDNVESFRTPGSKNGLELLLPRAIKSGCKVPAIIVTTRYRNWSDFTIKDLQGFDEKESLALLSTLNFEDNEENRKLVEEVRKLCQDLPLGLQQVISQVKHRRNVLSAISKDYDLKNFLEEVTLRKLEYLSTKPVGEISAHSLFTIIEMSSEQIASMNNGILALRCLYTIALLNPDNIPTVLLEYIFSDEDHKLAEALSLLHNYSLVTRCGGFHQIHRLVQEITIESSKFLKLKVKNTCTTKTMKCLTEFLEEMPLNFGQLHEVLDTAVRVYDKASPDDQNDVFVKFEKSLWDKLQAAGSYNIALRINSRAVERRTKEFGSNNPKTINMKFNLGRSLENTGKYDEASQIYQDVLQMEIQTLGSNHPSTLNAKHNLALVLNKQGKYDEAAQIYQDVLQMFIQTLGPNHPNTLSTKNNLASVLDDQGKYDEASQIYQDVLQMKIQTLGPNHPDTLTTKHNLALVLDNQGKYDEASQIYQDVLQMDIQTLGPNHPDTLTTKHNLALVLDNQGKYDEASQIYQDVLQMDIQTLGPNHPDTLTTKHNLALVLDNQGKYDEASQIYQDVLQMDIQTLGPNHPDTLTTKHNLALVLDKQGKYDEASQIYQDVLQMKIQTLGPNHPDTLTTKHNLALVLDNQGKYDEASQIYQDVLQMDIQTLGPNHPDTLTTKHNLALVLDKQGKYDEASQIYQDVLQMKIQTLGPNHPDTLTTKHNLALVLDNQGKYDEASQIYQDVLQIRIQTLGPNHPSTLNTKHRLALLLKRKQ